MKYKTLEYSDRKILSPLLRKKNSSLSEYNFTNAYLFRNPHKYEIAYCNLCTFLKGISYDGYTYTMPVCPIETIPLENLVTMGSNVDFFFPIQKEWLIYFPEDLFEYSYSEGDSDYIYLTERLATLAGRKLSKKRNLLKQYNELYITKDLPLTTDKFNDAKQVLDIWLAEIKNPHEGNDYKECLEALEKLDELKLEGIIFYADNKPSGFVLGEGLNDEVFALHFAKGAREYKGIYQNMYKAFATTLLSRYKYINFEQDLGKDSLRQSKSTYYPDHMFIKYRVKLKNK